MILTKSNWLKEFLHDCHDKNFLTKLNYFLHTCDEEDIYIANGFDNINDHLFGLSFIMLKDYGNPKIAIGDAWKKLSKIERLIDLKETNFNELKIIASIARGYCIFINTINDNKDLEKLSKLFSESILITRNSDYTHIKSQLHILSRYENIIYMIECKESNIDSLKKNIIDISNSGINLLITSVNITENKKCNSCTKNNSI
jgi:hypothetical protein